MVLVLSSSSFRVSGPHCADLAHTQTKRALSAHQNTSTSTRGLSFLVFPLSFFSAFCFILFDALFLIVRIVHVSKQYLDYIRSQDLLRHYCRLLCGQYTRTNSQGQIHSWEACLDDAPSLCVSLPLHSCIGPTLRTGSCGVRIAPSEAQERYTTNEVEAEWIECVRFNRAIFDYCIGFSCHSLCSVPCKHTALIDSKVTYIVS